MFTGCRGRDAGRRAIREAHHHFSSSLIPAQLAAFTVYNKYVAGENNTKALTRPNCFLCNRPFYLLLSLHAILSDETVTSATRYSRYLRQRPAL